MKRTPSRCDFHASSCWRKADDAFAAFVQEMFRRRFRAIPGMPLERCASGKENEIDQAGTYIGPLAMKHHG